MKKYFTRMKSLLFHNLYIFLIPVYFAKLFCILYVILNNIKTHVIKKTLFFLIIYLYIKVSISCG